jgi:hypothetical protein
MVRETLPVFFEDTSSCAALCNGTMSVAQLACVAPSNFTLGVDAIARPCIAWISEEVGMEHLRRCALCLSVYCNSLVLADPEATDTSPSFRDFVRASCILPCLLAEGLRRLPDFSGAVSTFLTVRPHLS